MEKTMTITEEEYMRLYKVSDQYRLENQRVAKLNSDLMDELKFIKENGNEVLVIIKKEGSPDQQQYISEKNKILEQMIQYNRKMYDDYQALRMENMTMMSDIELYKENCESVRKEKDELIKKINELTTIIDNYKKSFIGKLFKI